MNVCFLVGEPSGDLHTHYVIQELQKIVPNVLCWGMAGEKMASAGCEVIVDSNEMAVMGFAEVIKHLPTIRRNSVRLKNTVLERNPDVIVYVDYPGFNLRFARWVKQQSLPNPPKQLGYISPQVWAWKSNRIQKIAQYYDGLAVVFPFETSIYSSTELDVRFVGHPLLEELQFSISKEKARIDLGLTENTPVVSFLPGSRTQEIHNHTSVIIETFLRLKEWKPNLIGLLPMVTSVPSSNYDSFRKIGIQCFENSPSLCIIAADAAVVASGTATLQTALLETPMVVIYKTSALTFSIGKRIVHVKDIALSNLVMGHRIAAERLQKDANPNQLFADVVQLLGENGHKQVMDYKPLRDKLGGIGSSKKVAEWIVELANKTNE